MMGHGGFGIISLTQPSRTTTFLSPTIAPSGMQQSRSPHAATHHKKPSFSSFTSLPGRPSMQSISNQVSKPMQWLSRSSTSTSDLKPTHKPMRSIEVVGSHAGALGSGAIVVRTPDEALKDSGVRLPSSPHQHASEFEHRTLPDLPSELESDDEGERVDHYSVPSSSDENVYMPHPPRPTRSPPACPTGSSRTLLSIDETLETPPSPFRVLLMSETPNTTVDRSKVIVTLETCTKAFRTTLDTLLSQPSYLSEYLLSLFPLPPNMSCSSSVYSTGSEGENELQEMYKSHLISQGLLSNAPFDLHIFLDRPSSSYHSIISYLRSGSFPRLTTVEELLDLRDEACYLNLSTLHSMCAEEVRRQTGIGEAPVVHSMHASVHSLHALIEKVGHESRLGSIEEPDDNLERTVRRSQTHSGHGKAPSESGFKAPPTPQSWKNGRSSSTSHHGHTRGASTMSSRPPAGWL